MGRSTGSSKTGGSGSQKAIGFLDISGALLGLIVLSPLFVLAAVLIKLDSRGPIFYKAARMGRNGSIFRLYKFRSMIQNADRQVAVTVADDPRVTRVGRLLRRTKIDELPQLYNVLKREMSLVGPRPEDPRFLKYYNVEQQRLLKDRPGITSAASLLYRHEEELLEGACWEEAYVGEVLPRKLAIELDYLRHRNVWRDLAILLRTVRALFR